MADSTTPFSDGPMNVEQYPTVEPFGDERDLTARLVVMTNASLEVVRATDRIQTVEVGNLSMTSQLTPGTNPKVNLWVRDLSGNPLWVQDFAATARGIKDAMTLLKEAGLGIDNATANTIVTEMTYRMLGAGSDTQLVLEKLLTDEVDTTDPMLVEPFAKLDVPNQVIGGTGATKSINNAAMHLANASGRQIGPHIPIGDPVPRVIIDGEANRRDIDEIVRAIAHGHGIEVDPLIQKGLLHYLRISKPILGRQDELRQAFQKEGIGFGSIDSVDTARGGVATNQTGPYYDLLRYLGGTSVSLDHITLEMMEGGIEKYRTLASVRAVNRARQTWALRAGKPKDGAVTVQYRRNFSNHDEVGTGFKTDISFVMNGRRYESIHLAEPVATERALPNQHERVLIAMHVLEADNTVVTTEALADLTHLEDKQIWRAQSTLFKKKLIGANKDALTPGGRMRLDNEWPDGLPDPKVEGKE